MIERVLIFFDQKEMARQDLHKKFYFLGVLMQNLLKHRYKGKKLRFVNIHLRSSEFYLQYNEEGNTGFFNGKDITFDGVIDFEVLESLGLNEQKLMIWRILCDHLLDIGKTVGSSFVNAINQVKADGLKLNLNADFKAVEGVFESKGIEFEAAIWIKFKEEGMYSELLVSKLNGEALLVRALDNSVNGISFFLEIYKAIEFDGEFLIVKGHREIEYLPLKINISEFIKVE